MSDLYYEGDNYAELLTGKYAADILKLSKYIPYFENKKGNDVATKYEGKDGEQTLRFPVYDSTLLSFAAEAAKTTLMDPNYIYRYRQYHISTEEAEKKAVKDAKPKDIDLLKGVLSRYVLEGRYKGTRWIEATERGIFYDVLVKFMDMYNFVKTDHRITEKH